MIINRFLIPYQHRRYSCIVKDVDGIIAALIAIPNI